MRQTSSPRAPALLMLVLVAQALPLQAQTQGAASGGGNPWAVFEACMACHDREAARIGPSFAAIKARYAPADGSAVGEPATPSAELLAQRIREGSSGRWGAVPMPANSQLSPAQALAAAHWILGSKPASAQTGTAPSLSSTTPAP